MEKIMHYGSCVGVKFGLYLSSSRTWIEEV